MLECLRGSKRVLMFGRAMQIFHVDVSPQELILIIQWVKAVVVYATELAARLFRLRLGQWHDCKASGCWQFYVYMRVLFTKSGAQVPS